MEPTKDLDSRDPLTRALIAVGLGAFALWSLRNGNRLRGLLAGAGAIALGYSASTDTDTLVDQVPERPDTEPAEDDTQRRCAICGDPIVTGQSRVPDENDDTVHETCLEAPH